MTGLGDRVGCEATVGHAISRRKRVAGTKKKLVLNKINYHIILLCKETHETTREREQKKEKQKKNTRKPTDKYRLYKNRIKSTCPVVRDMTATAADVIG